MQATYEMIHDEANHLNNQAVNSQSQAMQNPFVPVEVEKYLSVIKHILI